VGARICDRLAGEKQRNRAQNHHSSSVLTHLPDATLSLATLIKNACDLRFSQPWFSNVWSSLLSPTSGRNDVIKITVERYRLLE
jgi:hypothetical protein